MEWTKDTILHFLKLIKERPAIWDIESPDYKCKQKRHDAIEEVAVLMGVTTKKVYTKWTVLRNQYSREKRKLRGMPTGSGSDASFSTTWYAYNAMEMLLSSNRSNRTSIGVKQDNSPPQPRSPTPPACTPTPSSCTGTPPPRTPPSSGVRQAKKREDNGKIFIYEEAVQRLKAMREKKNEREKKNDRDDDDLTTYGSYIAAHLRKFPPHLQSKAKYQINNILYTLDMESLGDYSNGMDDSY